MKNIKIKLIKTENEINHLYKIVSEIWREAFTDMLGEVQVEYMLKNYQSPKIISRDINQGINYFTIEKENKVIGYFAYEIKPDMLFLSKLYINKSQRGKGVTSEIFSYLEEKAKQHKTGKIHLHVSRYNKLAISIYKHKGFKVVDSIDKELGDGFMLYDYYMEKEIHD